MLQSAALSALAGIRHAFFTREGGVSDGIYASLNGGVGSDDAPALVAENRARMAAALGVAPDRLLTAYQIHSPDVVTIDQPWAPADRPRADAIVTATRGLAIGVSTADCGPVLFADAAAGVIGAAHAGWRGAATGVLEATIAAMERCGAERGHIVAALGPMIRQPNYEVGPNSSLGSRPMMGRTSGFSSRRQGPVTPCSTFPAISPPAWPRRASAGSRTSATALMPILRAFSASAGRRTAARKTTGVTSMP